MTPVAFAQTARLFPGHHNDDVSGEANEIDDSADRSADFGNKASTDFSSSISTVVNTETGVVTSQDAEEDAEIEQELVEAVTARAQTGSSLRWRHQVLDSKLILLNCANTILPLQMRQEALGVLRQQGMAMTMAMDLGVFKTSS